MTQLIPLNKTLPNPWQMWPLDPAHVADLAAEYTAGAPLPPIVVRPDPHGKGLYQIAIGHHRVAARLQLKLADVEAEVRDLSDLELARLAIAENFKRRVPSAIEKARALQRLTGAPFNLSQAEASRNLGYAHAASASHLLRLLELPAPVQAHVHSGALPERLARPLVAVARALPQVAERVAAQVAQADPDAKESTLDDALSDALHKHGRPMWDAPWHGRGAKADFIPPPGAVTYVAEAAQKLGLTTLPACQGCEFHLLSPTESCARPACFDAKVTAWRWAEAGKAAKALGVALAAPGEQVKVIFNGHADDKPRAVAALKGLHGPDPKHIGFASLRLVATARPIRSYESETRARADLLGSSAAALATTDWPALKKALPESAKPQQGQASPPARQTEAEREKKWKAEQAQRQATRQEIARLITVAAESLAPRLPDSEPLLALLAAYHSYAGEFKAAKTLKARKVVLLRFLIEDAQEFDADLFGEDPDWDTPEGTRAALVALLGKFKQRVPAALAAPPEPRARAALRGRPSKTASRPARKPARPAKKARAGLRVPRTARQSWRSGGRARPKARR